MTRQSAIHAIKAIPKRTVLLFLALGFLIVLWVMPKEEREPKEPLDVWRLNEMKGAKTLPVLYLAGTYSEKSNKGRPGDPPPRSGQFEMYIRGTNEYFLKCWHGNQTNRPGPVVDLLSAFVPMIGRHYAGWWQVEMVVDDFGWTMSQRWGRFGTQGGGGGLGAGPNILAPGRRLWNPSGFVGAVEEGQINKDIWSKEVFEKLQDVSGFKIPRVIKLDRFKRSAVFHIEKHEFRDKPTRDWFLAQRDKYYGPYQPTAPLTKTNSPPAS